MIVALVLIVAVVALFQGFYYEQPRFKAIRPTTAYQQAKYKHKVEKNELKEKRKRGPIEFDGYATIEDYEMMSRDIASFKKEIPKSKLPEHTDMKYIPQPTYKLARYNNPPGTVELKNMRKMQFDRRMNGEGVANADLSMMAYPVVHFNAQGNCVSGEIFVMLLDKSVPDVERLLNANIHHRLLPAILSTQDDIYQEATFRTMTPIDFSVDSLKLIAKEKIGYNFDGIWQTNLWVYDFQTKKAKNLVEIREAIKYYWKNTKNTELTEKMWDIFPIGWSTDNPERIVVQAYAYTGSKPIFLGTWSIDYKGETVMLEDLHSGDVGVSVSGFKLVQDGVIMPSEVQKMSKIQKKKAKKAARKAKKEKKKLVKQYKKEIKQEIKQKDKEFKEKSKYFKKKERRVKTTTGVETTVDGLDITVPSPNSSGK